MKLTTNIKNISRRIKRKEFYEITIKILIHLINNSFLGIIINFKYEIYLNILLFISMKSEFR